MHPLNNNILLRSSLRYYVRHPWQVALSVVGIILGVAVVVSVDVANRSAKRAFEISMQTITGNATHQIVAAGIGLPDTLYTRLRIDLRIRPIAPIIEQFVVIGNNPPRPMRFLGIDPFAEPPFRPHFILGTNPLQTQLISLLTTSGAVLISDQLAKEFKVKRGDTLQIRVGSAKKSAVISGVVTPADQHQQESWENLILSDIATAQELLGMTGMLSRIELIVDQDSVLKKISRALPLGAQILPSETRTQTATQMVSAFNLNLTALSLLALIVGTFLIYNTMTFSVVQRRTYLGLIRSIGVTRKEIFHLILAEAFLVGVIGTVLGLIVGVVLGRSMVRLVTQSINDLYFVLSVTSVDLPISSLIKGLILGIIATLGAALQPAREATLAPVNVVMRRSALESQLQKKTPTLTRLAILFITIGSVILFIPSRHVLLSYAGIVPLVLGMALLTPAIMILLVRGFTPIFGRLLGFFGRISLRAIISQMSRTAVALAALSIAVATTIGVGTMIQNFRSTVINWLEHILSADIYIAAPRLIATQAYGDLDPILCDKIAQLPQVQYVNYYRERHINTSHGNIVLFTAKIGAHRYRNFSFKAGDPMQVWNAYQNEEAAIISEPFAYRHHLQVGDWFALPTDRGEHKFQIAGIYYDYGTDQGLFSIAHHTYRKYWEDDQLSGILVYAFPGTDIDRLIAQIRSLLQPEDEVIIQSNRSLLNISVEVFDRTFLITNVLQGLAIIVAFIGVLSALMAIHLERAREFGVLRAIGLTPRQLWLMVILQTSMMGFMAGFIAMPIGNILAMVLIKVVNERSFGWSIQFEILPQLLLQAMLLAIFAALLAGIYPALKMARTSPAQALREE
ncbi:MAG: ABC transporter permease [candidate division KSB1 bacterium]|nr:ABC transporter permease [candidate division KSB1 bacterium]